MTDSKWCPPEFAESAQHVSLSSYDHIQRVANILSEFVKPKPRIILHQSSVCMIVINLKAIATCDFSTLRKSEPVKVAIVESYTT